MSDNCEATTSSTFLKGSLLKRESNLQVNFLVIGLLVMPFIPVKRTVLLATSFVELLSHQSDLSVLHCHIRLGIVVKSNHLDQNIPSQLEAAY